MFLFFYLFRESASPSMWVRPVSRQEMPAGSSSASSTASVRTASSWTVPHNRTLVKTRSTPSSTPGALGVMSPERYMWTWSPLWLVSRLVCVFIFTFLISVVFIIVPAVLLCVVVRVYIHTVHAGNCGWMGTLVSKQQVQR